MDPRTRLGKRLTLRVFAVAMAVSLTAAVFSFATDVFSELVFLGLALILGLSHTFLYRGHNWARWVAVCLLIVSGAILSINGTYVIFLLVLTGSVFLILALVYFTCAVILMFSESVGDFILSQKMGVNKPALWSETPIDKQALPKLAARPPPSISAVKKEALHQSLIAAQWRVLVSRVAKGIINLSYLAGAGVLCLVLLILVVVLVSFLSTGKDTLQDISGRPEQNPGFSFERLLIAAPIGIAFLFVPFIILNYAIKYYLIFFFLPFLFTLPLTALVAILWKRPARFLLLRPFNRSWVTRSLRGIMRREVARFGHIYSLADADIKIPWYVRVPIFLGQFSLFNFRFRKIRKPINLHRLRHAMRRLRFRNLNWCVSSWKIFPVACIDPAWKTCVTTLLREVDVILLDLSGLRGGVIWELEACRRMGLMNRVVFVVHEDELKEIEERFKADKLLKEIEFSPVLYEKNYRLKKPESLRWRVAEMLARNGGAGNLKLAPIPVPSIPKSRIITLVAGALLAVGIAAWILLSPPIQLPLTAEQQSIGSVAFSQNSTTIVSKTDKDEIISWDAYTGQIQAKMEARVKSVAISPDGKTVAYGDFSGIWLWDCVSKPRRASMSSADEIVFIPSGKILAANHFGQIEFLDVASMQSAEIPLDLDSGFLSSPLAFSSDGRLLAEGEPSGNDVLVYEVDTGREFRRLSDHPRGINDVQFGPWGRLLAVAAGNEVILWDLMVGEASEKPIARLKMPHWLLLDIWRGDVGKKPVITIGESEMSVAFTPDGKYLIGAKGYDLFMWDLATHKSHVLRAEGRPYDTLGKIAVSPDGRLLAAASYGGGRVWSLAPILSAVTRR